MNLYQGIVDRSLISFVFCSAQASLGAVGTFSELLSIISVQTKERKSTLITTIGRGGSRFSACQYFFILFVCVCVCMLWVSRSAGSIDTNMPRTECANVPGVRDTEWLCKQSWIVSSIIRPWVHRSVGKERHFTAAISRFIFSLYCNIKCELFAFVCVRVEKPAFCTVSSFHLQNRRVSFVYYRTLQQYLST